MVGAFSLERHSEKRREVKRAVQRARRLLGEMESTDFAAELTRSTGKQFQMSNALPMSDLKGDILMELEAAGSAASQWFAVELLIREATGELYPLHDPTRIISPLSYRELGAEIDRLLYAPWRRRRSSWYQKGVADRMRK